MGIELLSRHIGMRDSKANIIALSGVLEEQAIAYATDSGEVGIYTNGAWIWISPTNNLYIDQAGGSGDTYGVLSGARNGINTQYTVSQSSYVSGTLLVFLNGQLQTQGSAEDWQETVPASGTFDFAVAPTATDEITVIYGFLGIGIGGGYTQGARVYNNANISINDSVNTALTFNSERYDTDNIHDVGVNPSRLTCKHAGKYLIIGNVTLAAKVVPASYRIQLFIYLGNTTYIGWTSAIAYSSGSGSNRVSISTIYDLAINQYVELVVEQESGEAINVLSVGNYSPEFMMQRIG